MSLNALLSDGARFAPEYHGGLSNHLPMALVALQRLGADEARLEAFAVGYAERLAPAPAVQAWSAGDAWRGRFGEPEAWPAYRSLMAEWIAQEGAGAVLAQALPALMPGCGAGAFHGPIRVAYAVASGHEPELADALAYWACRHLPLGPLPQAPGRVADPEALLRRLQAGRSRQPLIAQRMRDAAASPALHAEIARLAIDAGTLERLARLSAKAYTASGNFTALHLLTACHAMRVLQGLLDDPLEALRWFWQAWATAVVAAGLTQKPPRPVLDWDRIVPRALASDDEHVVKLIDSCREEERAYGGDDWRRAASRAVAVG
ncbi:questin oxidase family protein [Ideonella sp. A 288]|uniref:questin oxidase family protein n=1 Tax=Ideonella sp. A 288 TaxID=1962181 RepID=UPI000B4B2AE8|nr:questin oxidase family protein [Ideonella sp. A 288]